MDSLANTLTQAIAEWKLRDTFEGNRPSRPGI